MRKLYILPIIAMILLTAGCIDQVLGLRNPIEDAARFMPGSTNGFAYVNVATTGKLVDDLELLDRMNVDLKQDQQEAMDLIKEVEWVGVGTDAADSALGYGSHQPTMVAVAKLRTPPKDFIDRAIAIAERQSGSSAEISWKTEEYKGVTINIPYDASSSYSTADGGYYAQDGRYMVMGSMDSLKASINALQSGTNAVEWVKGMKELVPQGDVFLAGETRDIEGAAAVRVVKGTVIEAEIAVKGEKASELSDSLEQAQDRGDMPIDFDFEISRKEGVVRIKISNLDLKEAVDYWVGGATVKRAPMPSIPSTISAYAVSCGDRDTDPIVMIANTGTTSIDLSALGSSEGELYGCSVSILASGQQAACKIKNWRDGGTISIYGPTVASATVYCDPADDYDDYSQAAGDEEYCPDAGFICSDEKCKVYNPYDPVTNPNNPIGSYACDKTPECEMYCTGTTWPACHHETGLCCACK